MNVAAGQRFVSRVGGGQTVVLVVAVGARSVAGVIVAAPPSRPEQIGQTVTWNRAGFVRSYKPEEVSA